MTEKEVQCVFDAKPLESGKVEAGDYRIYGVLSEFIDVQFGLYFSNILVVFREGRAAIVIDVPATIHCVRGSRRALLIFLRTMALWTNRRLLLEGARSIKSLR